MKIDHEKAIYRLRRGLRGPKNGAASPPGCCMAPACIVSKPFSPRLYSGLHFDYLF
jgi:hypothetical protein